MITLCQLQRLNAPHCSTSCYIRILTARFDIRFFMLVMHALSLYRTAFHRLHDASRKKMGSSSLTKLVKLQSILNKATRCGFSRHIILEQWPVAFKQPRFQSCGLRDLQGCLAHRCLVRSWTVYFDEAIDQWRGRHRACVHAKGRHFEYSLWTDYVDFVLICYTQCDLFDCYIFNYEIMPATLANTFLFILQGSAQIQIKFILRQGS